MRSLKRSRYEAQQYSEKKTPVTLSGNIKEILHFLQLAVFSGSGLLNSSEWLKACF